MNTVCFSENFDCVLHTLLKHKKNVNFVFILQVNSYLSVRRELLQFLSVCCVALSLEVLQEKCKSVNFRTISIAA